MFADPLVLNYYGNKSFFRQGVSNPEVLGRFVFPEANLTLDVRQNKTANRFRREIRFTEGKVVTDPISGAMKEASASCILAFDEPRFGWTDTQLIDLYSGILSFINPNDLAMLKRVVAGEN